MKNVIKLGIILLLIVPLSNSLAQLKIGAIGGMNLASFRVDDDEISNRILWGAGLVLNYPLSNNFSIQAEPMFLKKGGLREQNDTDPKLTLEQDFLEVPLLAHYSFGDSVKLFFVAGPTFGITLSSEMEGDINGITFTADMKEVTESLDLGLSVGGGVSTKINNTTIFLEVKYAYGLTNLAKSGKYIAKAGHLEIEDTFDANESRYKSQGIQIMAGFTFPL